MFLKNFIKRDLLIMLPDVVVSGVFPHRKGIAGIFSLCMLLGTIKWIGT